MCGGYHTVQPLMLTYFYSVLLLILVVSINSFPGVCPLAYNIYLRDHAN